MGQRNTSFNPLRRSLQYESDMKTQNKKYFIVLWQATLEEHNRKMHAHFGDAKPKVSIRTLQTKLDRELITFEVCQKGPPLNHTSIAFTGHAD